MKDSNIVKLWSGSNKVLNAWERIFGSMLVKSFEMIATLRIRPNAWISSIDEKQMCSSEKRLFSTGVQSNSSNLNSRFLFITGYGIVFLVIFSNLMDHFEWNFEGK